MLYQRKDEQGRARPVWWVKVTLRGRTVQRSTRTTDRIQAQEVHDQLRAELWRGEALGQAPVRTWEDAAGLYLKESAHKRSHASDVQRLRYLLPRLVGRPLTAINRQVVDAALAPKALRAQPATLNRYVSVVRSVLALARAQGWIDAVPPLRTWKEPARRVHWLTKEQADRLVAALPGHLQAPARFSLATGLRQGNVFGLTWDQVDLERRVAWVHADQAKTGKAIAVPLNDTALEALRHAGTDGGRVWRYNGRPLQRPDVRTWRRACEVAGVPGTRWHDLRHTWASWHVQAGTPLQSLMELGGWSSYDMVLRYAHLDPGRLQQLAGAVG